MALKRPVISSGGATNSMTSGSVLTVAVFLGSVIVASFECYVTDGAHAFNEAVAGMDSTAQRSYAGLAEFKNWSLAYSVHAGKVHASRASVKENAT